MPPPPLVVDTGPLYFYVLNQYLADPDAPRKQIQPLLTIPADDLAKLKTLLEHGNLVTTASVITEADKLFRENLKQRERVRSPGESPPASPRNALVAGWRDSLFETISRLEMDEQLVVLRDVDREHFKTFGPTDCALIALALREHFAVITGDDDLRRKCHEDGIDCHFIRPSASTKSD